MYTKYENNFTHFKCQFIATTFLNYFKYILSSHNIDACTSYLATQLAIHSNVNTYSILDKEEILNALKDMKLHASLGPDEFNVEFYLATWEWIGDDVTTLVRQFYHTCILSAHIYHTNIVLIPKELVPIPH